jgi:hypothetical protein
VFGGHKGDGRVKTKWPRDTARLLIRELRDKPSGSDFVAWAVQALCDGYDSPTLRLLAGLDLDGLPSAFEASEKFRAVLDELGIQLPDEPTLLRTYVEDVARAIVQGNLEPQAAVAQIHREVLTPFEHPTDLMAWCYLWEGLDPKDYSSLEGEALDQAIHQAAQQWAGGAAEQGAGGSVPGNVGMTSGGRSRRGSG